MKKQMQSPPNYTRRHERKLYGADVIFAHKGRLHNGTLKDIRLGGAFIITTMPNKYSVGDKITVSIPFTAGDTHIKRDGHITWLNDEGFAVEF